MEPIRLYIRKIISEMVDVETLSVTKEDLIEILKGYLEAALWTEEEQIKAEYEGIEFSLDDLDGDSKIQAYLDIKEFINNAGKNAITEAIDENGLSKLGHDLWLTRNHHGAGFFDHSYEHEKELTDAAQNLKEVYLYVGDDMKLYFSNAY